MIRTISGFAARRPLFVIVAWLAIVGAGFGIGGGVFERLVSDVGTVPGSESGRAADRLAAAAPRPETLTAVISGRPAADPALRQSVASAIGAARAVPGVAEVSEPLPSAKTGNALLVEVRLAPGDGQEETAEAVAERLHGIDADVTVAGGPLSDAEFDEQAQKDVARAEMLSMPVVLVLLLVVFGGLLAAGLPVLIAVVGVGGTFGVLFAFSTVTDISVYVIQVTTMLAIGLAVDYALLMVNRFREERSTAPDVATAVTRTTATAGRTVMFSGLTVAVALAGLVVFPDPFLRSMGLAGSAVVLVDMVAALTLLPALLTRFGHRISPAKRRAGAGMFARVARGVQRRPVLTLVVTAGAMAALAAPVLGLHISQGDPRMLPGATSTRQMWDGLTEHFPDQAQWSGDIQVLADAPANDPELDRLRGTVAAIPGITGVEVDQLGPDLTVLSATPRGPADGAAARDAVTAIRDLSAPFRIEVTGDSAELVDYRAMLIERLPWAVALVALGTLMLLFAFTGSVLLPVKAVLTNLLSIGAALGIVVWVFQEGHLAGLLGTEGLGYVHLTVPVLIGAIAFGLSVDYEVFLLSRIRERWLAGAGPQGSVAEGLQRTGGIVTAAAAMIAVVFAGFIFGGFVPIKAIGLGLALAITLDATIVRMLLVPATMTLLGRRNWWMPGPLRRVHARLALSESAPEAPEAASPPAAPALAG
ncbi:MMPL family transporter [Actinomadura sp. HBU206391]|uniref:MMPL family transporter n=1 Tax=Actinomadura sp. HBU206391 TaxID=2731692 RepID=UPI0016500F18|nr:efflux RND transporter permease subunit [Actinomadura sp. HBU206391]MBC6462560.1 MMPL family transporter [Actinomadura sp. HBU206391]